MRLLSRVLKDNDVMMDSHGLALDKDNKLSLKLVPNEKAIKKENEILLQARIKVHQMMEDADGKVKKIMQDASKKIKEEMNQARITGREEGYAAGKAEGLKEVESTVGELTRLISSINKEKKDILSNFEDGLKDLSLGIAQKIIDTELQRNDQLFLSIYSKAIDQYNEEEWVKITVSEYEADFVTANTELLLSMAKGAKDIKIEVLQNAPRGTCIVETPLSVIDASVSIQLRKLEESFSNVGVSV